MKNGVSILNPVTVLIDDGVAIGKDTIIHQGSIIEGNSCVGERCSIGPFTRIIDSTLGNNVEMGGWNYIRGADLGDGSRVKAYESKGEEEKC
jgi:bifunctional UDP-N-acetylglucosamine pyrophosphorylase/glucosamine-1-phosphate N-acetyltransferase